MNDICLISDFFLKDISYIFNLFTWFDIKKKPTPRSLQMDQLKLFSTQVETFPKNFTILWTVFPLDVFSLNCLKEESEQQRDSLANPVHHLFL